MHKVILNQTALWNTFLNSVCNTQYSFRTNTQSEFHFRSCGYIFMHRSFIPSVAVFFTFCVLCCLTIKCVRNQHYLNLSSIAVLQILLNNWLDGTIKLVISQHWLHFLQLVRILDR